MESRLVAEYLENERQKRALTAGRREVRNLEKKWFQQTTGIRYRPVYEFSMQKRAFVEKAVPQATDPLVKRLRIRDKTGLYTWSGVVSAVMKGGRGTIQEASRLWREGELVYVPERLRKRAENWAASGRPAPLPSQPTAPSFPFASREAARAAGARLQHPRDIEAYRILERDQRTPRFPAPQPRPRVEPENYMAFLARAPVRVSETEVAPQQMAEQPRKLRPTGINAEYWMRALSTPIVEPEVPMILNEERWKLQPWTELLIDKSVKPATITQKQLEKLWNLGFRLSAGRRTQLKPAATEGGSGGLPQSGALGRVAYILNNLRYWYEQTGGMKEAQEARKILSTYYPAGIPLTPKGSWWAMEDYYFNAVEAAFGPFTEDNWAPGGKGGKLYNLHKLFPPSK